MVGRARLVCDIDERWNGPPPRCEPILCHTPPDIPNGRYVMSNNNTIAGTVVEYSCDSRKFKLVGAKKLVCLPIGQYDKLPPVCKEDTGRPLGGLLGAVNKATTKPVGRPPRPPLVTLTPSTPPREDVDYEGIARRPTKVPISKVSTPVTEKTYVIPTRTTTQKPIEAKTSHGIAGHPQENEIPDSVNIRSDVQPNVNVPSSVEEDRRETSGARLNLGTTNSLPWPKIIMKKTSLTKPTFVCRCHHITRSLRRLCIPSGRRDNNRHTDKEVSSRATTPQQLTQKSTFALIR